MGQGEDPHRSPEALGHKGSRHRGRRKRGLLQHPPRGPRDAWRRGVLIPLTCNVAIIGGTGLYDRALLDGAEPTTVGTPYGIVSLFVGSHAGRGVVFLPRHGAGHSVPPHRVNYRANIWALRQLGVRRVLATAACGTMAKAVPPGSLTLCDQFIDFTKSRAATFFDGEDGRVHHADMTEPYCPGLRARLLGAAARQDLALGPKATYVCTEGPRFETPAEIAAFARLGGHLVGMTGVPEVVLAREAGLCYAGVAIATNWAAGLAGQPLSHAEVVAAMAEAVVAVRRLLLAAIADMDETACGVCPEPPGAVGG